MSGEGYDEQQHQELRDAGRLIAPPPARDLDEALGEQIVLTECYADELAQARDILARAKNSPPDGGGPMKLERWYEYVARCEKVVEALEGKNAELAVVITLDRWRQLNPDPREVGE